MDPQSFNFFILAIIGATVLYGLAPAFFPAAAILLMLWVLAVSPLLFCVLAVVYVLRTPLRWAAEGLIFGWSARLSVVFNSPERAERQRERWQAQRRRPRRERGPLRARGRRGDRDYFPWSDNIDHLGD